MNHNDFPYRSELRGQNIVYFSSDEWSSGLVTSQYHYCIRLAEKNRVLYVNSIGLRKPGFSRSDVTKIIRKLAGFFRGLRRIGSNLWVLTPVVLPYHGVAPVRKINGILLRLYIGFALKRLHFGNPIVWTFLPNIMTLVDKMNKKGLIYFCADEASKFNGVQGETFVAEERKLLCQADAVFVSSKRLYEAKQPANKNTFYLPHGVDFLHFHRALMEETEIPEDVRTVPKPIIGFFGHVSKDWIDYDLIKYLASRNPGWSIVLIGKHGEDTFVFRSFTNVRILGTRPYDELPSYLKAFDVATIPFVKSELTANSNPIKLKEYLAGGVPVVSTRIPEIEATADFVDIADSHREFESMVRRCLEEDQVSRIEKGIEFARNESWEARMVLVENVLSNTLHVGV